MITQNFYYRTHANGLDDNESIPLPMSDLTNASKVLKSCTCEHSNRENNEIMLSKFSNDLYKVL